MGDWVKKRVGYWVAGGVLAAVPAGIADWLFHNTTLTMVVAVITGFTFGWNIESMRRKAGLMPQTENLCPNGHASNANGNCTTDGCVYRVIT